MIGREASNARRAALGLPSIEEDPRNPAFILRERKRLARSPEEQAAQHQAAVAARAAGRRAQANRLRAEAGLPSVDEMPRIVRPKVVSKEVRRKCIEQAYPRLNRQQVSQVLEDWYRGRPTRLRAAAQVALRKVGLE